MRCLPCLRLLLLLSQHGHAKRISLSRRPSRFLLPEGAKKRDFTLNALYQQLVNLQMKEYETRGEGSWEMAKSTNKWDLLWSWEYTHFAELGKLKAHNRVNHIPGSGAISIKNQIYQTVSTLERTYDKELFEGLVPQHFLLPKEVQALERVQAEQPNRKWMLKFQQHRGVRFLDNTKDIRKDEDAMIGGNMVAELVEPYLLEGYKFDVGVFVLVASLEPLRIFIHDNPKLRFCQLPYPETLNGDADPDSYRIAPGHRCTAEVPALKKYFLDDNGNLLPPEVLNTLNEYEILKQYMEKEGIDCTILETQLHQRIVNLVAGIRPTLLEKIQNATKSGSSRNFFELFRFDFLINSELEPVLMEVNASPNMVPTKKNGMSDGPAKGNILHDTVKIILAEPSSSSMGAKHSAKEVTAIQQALGQSSARGRYKMVVPSKTIDVSPFMTPLDQAQWNYIADGSKAENEPRFISFIPGLIVTSGLTIVLVLMRRRGSKAAAYTR